MSQLVLKRAAASRLSGEWSDDDYDVLAEGIVVGRIMKAAVAAPLPAWRRDERESRTDISQVELQLHGLRVAPRRGLHQLRREDRGADPRGPAPESSLPSRARVPAARRSSCTSPPRQSADARRSRDSGSKNARARF